MEAIVSLGARARGDIAASVGKDQPLRVVTGEKAEPLPDSVQGPSYGFDTKDVGIEAFIKLTFKKEDAEGDPAMAAKIADAQSYAMRLPGLAASVQNFSAKLEAAPTAEQAKFAPILQAAMKELNEANQKLNALIEELSGDDGDMENLRVAGGAITRDVQLITVNPATALADLIRDVDAINAALTSLMASARTKVKKTPVFFARLGGGVLFAQSNLNTEVKEATANVSGRRWTLFLDLGLPVSSKMSLVVGGELQFPTGSLSTQNCTNGLCGLEGDTYLLDGGPRTIPIPLQDVDFTPGVGGGGSLGVEIPMGEGGAFASVRAFVMHQPGVDIPIGEELAAYGPNEATLKILNPTFVGATAAMSYDEVVILNKLF